MKYPYNLLNYELFPIFADKLKGAGVFVSLADGSEVFEKIDINDQKALQAYADDLMSEANTNWAVSDFGENRKFMFSELGHLQMVEEGRFFHLGLDIWAPVGFELFAPLAGEIVVSEYEAGAGNYGGMVVVKHEVEKQTFYTVYGHLNKDKLPVLGLIQKADRIGFLGEMDSNGGYFYHVHLQVLTEVGFKKGFTNKGYATLEDFQKIEKYCLDPRFLFKI